VARNRLDLLDAQKERARNLDKWSLSLIIAFNAIERCELKY
jgi:hypothetical protein